jgi:hypothetical protein
MQTAAAVKAKMSQNHETAGVGSGSRLSRQSTAEMHRAPTARHQTKVLRSPSPTNCVTNRSSPNTDSHNTSPMLSARRKRRTDAE